MPLIAIFKRIRAKTPLESQKDACSPNQDCDSKLPHLPLNTGTAGHASLTFQPLREGTIMDTNNLSSATPVTSHMATVDISAAQGSVTITRPVNLPSDTLQVSVKRDQQVTDTGANVPLQGAPSNFYSTSGSFANARNTVFHGPVNMYDVVQSTHPLIQRLAENAKPEAIHDSSYREYPPRCHEDTRTSLRKDVVAWRDNPNRLERMRWYMGPAAVGKSAIAQSISEELDNIGRLGGSFFFFRPGQIDDPASVIPTLAYQLAIKNNSYRQIITKLLTDDPLLLTKNRPIQFNKLIIEPFQNMIAARGCVIEDPLLIILDGLDECRGKEAQCELLQLILDHVRRVKWFPLLWLIFSRPEWHLKIIASDVDFPAACEKREIDVDDIEAQEDVRRLFEAELVKVQKQYAGYLPIDWPPKEDVNLLCTAASGHLGFASSMARFIADAEVGDPEKQFQICKRITSGLGVDQGTRVNPLEALDCLYYRILSDVPTDVLPVAMQILSLNLFMLVILQNVRDQVNFLCISQASYARALKQLHSVVNVPTPREASFKPLHFYHASFVDFLVDPARSGKFHLSRRGMTLYIAVQCLRWLDQNSSQPPIAHDHVYQFTLRAGWQTSCLVSEELLPDLMDELACFDFASLRDPSPGEFAEFIRWLYTKAPPNHLVELVDERPRTVVRTLVVEHTAPTSTVEGWIADFFPESKDMESPLPLHFLLGVASRIHVYVTVIDET